MGRQIGQRLISLVIILFGLSILTFGLTFLLPSGPVEQVIEKMGITPDPEVIAELKHEYGFAKLCHIRSREVLMKNRKTFFRIAIIIPISLFARFYLHPEFTGSFTQIS